MNANAYGGELARVLEWVDVDQRRAGRRAPHSRPARLRLPTLGPAAPARSWRAPASRCGASEPEQGQGDAGGHARAAQGRPAVGDQDVRFHLQEPRRSPRGGPDRGPAARRGRLPRAAGRRRRILGEARELRRQRRRRDHRRRDRADGRGPPARPRAASASSSSRRSRRSGPVEIPPEWDVDERAWAVERAAPCGGASGRWRRDRGDSCRARRSRSCSAAAGCGCAIRRLVAVQRVTVTGESGPDARRDPRGARVRRAQHDDARRVVTEGAARGGLSVPGGQEPARQHPVPARDRGSR